MTSLTLYTKLETLPSELKIEAEKFINELVKKHNDQKNIKSIRPKLGSLKGKIWLSDDFDDPLDDFNDYM